MKYIITEEQNTKLKFLRRKRGIIDHIKNTYSYLHPCDYDNFYSFMYGVKIDLSESYYGEWLDELEEEEFWKLIDDEFSDKLKMWYNSRCKN